MNQAAMVRHTIPLESGVCSQFMELEDSNDLLDELGKKLCSPAHTSGDSVLDSALDYVASSIWGVELPVCSLSIGAGRISEVTGVSVGENDITILAKVPL